MATRYTVTVLREEYVPASDHITGRVTYEVADCSLLGVAVDCVVQQCTKWGWLADVGEVSEP